MLLVKFNTVLLILISFTNQCLSARCDRLLLTPYIESNRLAEAKRLSAVTELPLGYHVKSYSGFLTVNKQFNSNLFFWFFPSVKNSETAPVLLWLNGGPGASTMYGLFVENGPFHVSEDLVLVKNKYSWTQEFSVIYIDNPVGTGFSYTMDSNGYARNQTTVANDLYEGLQQFFKLFGEYRNNEFYVTGESYGGKYVPAIGYKLHQKSSESNINFKGIAFGNGFTDPINMLDTGSFLFRTGLIDENQMNYFHKIQNKTAIEIKNKNYRNAFWLQDNLIGGYLINGTSYFTKITGFTFLYNILQSEQPKDFDYFPQFLNKQTTQKAIHVGCVNFSSSSNTVLEYLLDDMYVSYKPWFRTLIDNYKVMVYSGQLDIIIGTAITENFLKHLDWKYSEEFSVAKRLIWKLNDEVVGYVKHTANFTQVTVRNAGHLVPYYQPKVALEMITRFVKS